MPASLGSASAVAIIGTGTIGSALVNELLSNPRLSKSISLRVIMNSRKMIFGDNLGMDWQEQLEGKGATADHGNLLEYLREYERTTIVDCTASDDIPCKYYEQWLRTGCNVVTANKKGLSGKQSLYDAVNCEKLNGRLKFESTVGAGLPVVEFISNAIQAGDQILKIEAVLSGTLSFIFNKLSSKVSTGTASTFSRIVKDAISEGYTEPDPREDLAGIDVARKAVILARLLGMHEISLNDMMPEPLYPTLMGEKETSALTVPEFVGSLHLLDAAYEKMVQNAAKQGSVLRFIATIEPLTKMASVSLKSLPCEHVLAGLTGCDNAVTIKTIRFPNGVSLVGAGAGPASTIHGLVCDLLKV